MPLQLSNNGFIYGLNAFTRFIRETPLVLESCDQTSGLACGVPPPICWWNVELYGAEQYRLVSASGIAASGPMGQPQTMPWPAGGIYTFAPPNAPSSRSTHIKGRVRYGADARDPRVVDVDIGFGTRFSVLTNFVKVNLLLPVGYTEVLNGQPGVVSPTPAEGDVEVSAVVVGHIFRSESPIYRSKSSWSETVFIGEVDDVGNEDWRPIPSAAHDVTVYQTEDGTITPLHWVQYVTMNAASVAQPGPMLGQLDFEVAMRRTKTAIVPQGATHLGQETGIDQRVLTLVWGLEL